MRKHENSNHKGNDEFLKEAQTMNEFMYQPSDYEEIECEECGKTMMFGDACEEGWFDLYDFEGEDSYYICDECGELLDYKHCCFCGRTIREPFTNNPLPMHTGEGARCCNECDEAIVIPARLRNIIAEHEMEAVR